MRALAPSLSQIERVESVLLHHEQLDLPLVHLFAPGIYIREIFMPEGTFIIGHEHKTRHFNVVLTGRAAVMMDGEVREIIAPATFVSEPGVRKILYIREDMRWQTIHPTDETDVEKLEDQLVVKSASFLKYMEDFGTLKHHLHSKEPCHLQQ